MKIQRHHLFLAFVSIIIAQGLLVAVGFRSMNWALDSASNVAFALLFVLAIDLMQPDEPTSTSEAPECGLTMDELKSTLVIPLKSHELQSGLDRLRLAGSLIKQLPETHQGRNHWLAAYTKSNNVASDEWRVARGLGPYPEHNVDAS